MRKRKALCQRNVDKLDRLLSEFVCPYCRQENTGAANIQEPHDLDPYWHHNYRCACGSWCLFAFVNRRWTYMVIKKFDLKGAEWFMTYRSAGHETSFGPQGRIPDEDICLPGFVTPERFTNLLAFS